jgi:hypothetical protein
MAKLKLAVELTGSRNEPILAEQVAVSIVAVTQSRTVAVARGIDFKKGGGRAAVAFEAPKRMDYRAEVDVPRYRLGFSNFLAFDKNGAAAFAAKLPRIPDAWNPRFTAWDRLGAEFQALKNVLLASGPVQLLDGERSPLPAFHGPHYDDVDDRPLQLAKAALLNLYSAMRLEADPTGNLGNWFDGVTKVLSIGRERFVAEVSRDFFLSLSVIEGSPGDPRWAARYRKAGSSLHLKNFPTGAKFDANQVVSVKTSDTEGNLQFTCVPADNGARFLLDADIDENGNLLRHTFDLIRHKFTGGTHPFDVHEILAGRRPDLQLGYRLV